MQNMHKIELFKGYCTIDFIRFSLDFAKNCRNYLFFVEISVRKCKKSYIYKYAGIA